MHASKLSTLAILLGLGIGLPQIYGIVRPAAFATAVRRFPRSIPWGYALTLLGTAWFLWNLSQESISDFEKWKNILFAGFAAVCIGTCIFVKDFLAVRGLAVVLLLLARLMVGPPEAKIALSQTSSVALVPAVTEEGKSSIWPSVGIGCAGGGSGGVIASQASPSRWLMKVLPPEPGTGT